MCCDVDEATEGLENVLWLRWSDGKVGEWAEIRPIVIVIAELILQVFSHFTYVTAHSDSPRFPSLHLRHTSFTNPSLALPTSQLILQPFRCFTYITANTPTLLSPLLRHRIFTYVTWRAAHGHRLSNRGNVLATARYHFAIQHVLENCTQHILCCSCCMRSGPILLEP